MIFFDWYLITVEALEAVWSRFIAFIPLLFGALIIFAFGWIIAIWIGKLIAGVLKRLKFNQVFMKGTLKESLERAEIKIDASGFVGLIFKWILIIVFLQIAVGILGWYAFADILMEVIAYLPNVIIAALILVIAVILSDIFGKISRAAMESAKISYANLIEMIVRWSVLIFAILASMVQLEIADELIRILFIGIVALLVISCGLAFGLAGRETAVEILDNLRRKFKEK